MTNTRNRTRVFEALGHPNYPCLTLDELRSQLGRHSEQVCRNGRMRVKLRMSQRELNRHLDIIKTLHVVIAEREEAREWGTETTAA